MNLLQTYYTFENLRNVMDRFIEISQVREHKELRHEELRRA